MNWEMVQGELLSLKTAGSRKLRKDRDKDRGKGKAKRKGKERGKRKRKRKGKGKGKGKRRKRKRKRRKFYILTKHQTNKNKCLFKTEEIAAAWSILLRFSKC